MEASGCTSCGLRNCQCRRQASTTVSRGANDEELKITPACLCGCYSCWAIFLYLALLLFTGQLFNEKAGCYLDLFAHSVSVSNVNANISTADWSIGLTAMSPVSNCKISLHTIKSRLLRDDDVISESPTSLDVFGRLVTDDLTDGKVIAADFKKVVMPGVMAGVVRDYRVEIVAGVSADTGGGFLMVLCGDLPVKFTADSAGNVNGSLLGNMKRCDYLFNYDLNLSL